MIAARQFAETEDADLMVLASKGDVDAFVELYDLHYARLVRQVTYIMGHPRQSEDIAQQVFLNAYRARDTYVPTAKFTTWLFTIALNAVRRHQRTVSRRIEAVTSSQINENTDWLDSVSRSREIPTSTRLLTTESHGLALRAISNLSDDHRQVVELVLFGGCTYQQAAVAMDTSEQAIKSMLCRARGKLRSSLRWYQD